MLRLVQIWNLFLREKAQVHRLRHLSSRASWLHHQQHEFTDDYLTGIEIVDLEHQQLFCIVERAYQLVKSNDVITCYDELLSIIHELTDYTVTHFADEEAYMEKIGYEGLAAQKNAHASFVARLENINLIELDENPQKYMESLIEFLLGWLINHILYSDKKIPVQA